MQLRGVGLLGLVAVLGAACQRASTPAAAAAGPTIADVQPATGMAGRALDLTVTGSAFLGSASGDTGPVRFRLVRTSGLDGAPANEAVFDVVFTVVRGDTSLVVPISPSAARPGLYALEVTDPDQRRTTFPDALALLPAAPRLASAETEVVCVLQELPPFRIGLEDFVVVVGGGPPRAAYRVGPTPEAWTSYELPVTVTPVECTALPFTRARIERCLAAEVPGYLNTDGVWLELREPQGSATTWSLAKPLQQVGNPGVSWTFQDWIWTGRGTVEVPLLGGSYTFPRAAPPEVRIDDQVVAATRSGCGPGAVPAVDVCRDIMLPVTPDFPPGLHRWSVTTVGGCVTTGEFHVVGEATITSVGPAPVCHQGRLQIRGTGFVLPRPSVDGAPFNSPISCGDAPPPCDLVQLETTGLAPGPHTLILENGSAPPTTTAAVAFTTAPQTSVLTRRMPEVLLAGVSRPVAMWVKDVVGAIRRVRLVTRSLVDVVDLDFTWDAGLVTATLPPGLPPGTYLMLLSDDGPCPGDFAAVDLVADPLRFSVDVENGLSGWPTTPLFAPEGAGPSALAVAEEGNPGHALRVSSAGVAEPSYFRFEIGNLDVDFESIGFDLRVEGLGDPLPGPDVVIQAMGLGSDIWIEGTLAAPPGPAWRRTQLTLDVAEGWTLHDAGGSRPATAESLRDFRRTYSGVLWIKGVWTDGAGTTWLDNVSMTLNH